MLTNLSRYVLRREFANCLQERTRFPAFLSSHNFDLSELLHDLGGLMGEW